MSHRSASEAITARHSKCLRSERELSPEKAGWVIDDRVYLRTSF